MAEPRHTVTVRLHPDDYARLIALAALTSVTINDTIVSAVRDAAKRKGVGEVKGGGR